MGLRWPAGQTLHPYTGFGKRGCKDGKTSEKGWSVPQPPPECSYLGETRSLTGFQSKFTGAGATPEVRDLAGGTVHRTHQGARAHAQVQRRLWWLCVPRPAGQSCAVQLLGGGNSSLRGPPVVRMVALKKHVRVKGHSTTTVFVQEQHQVLTLVWPPLLLVPLAKEFKLPC